MSGEYIPRPTVEEGRGTCLRMELPRLDPSAFSLDLHERNYWSRLNMSATAVKAVRDRYRERATGYCDAAELPNRLSREGDWAVMMEDFDGEPFWFHFPKRDARITDAATGLDAEDGCDPEKRDDRDRAYGMKIDDGKGA